MRHCLLNYCPQTEIVIIFSQGGEFYLALLISGQGAPFSGFSALERRWVKFYVKLRIDPDLRDRNAQTLSEPEGSSNTGCLR